MYKNNILISLIFRPLETVEEDSCTELIQVNRSLDSNQNKAIIRDIMYNYKT